MALDFEKMLFEEMVDAISENSIFARKCGKKIPLDEIPNGERIKMGFLKDGVWKNAYLKTPIPLALLEKAEEENIRLSLEWIS